MTKAFLFDFDGTLADTAKGIVLTMQETFRTMGLPVPEDAAIIKTIGLPLVKCVQMLGGLSEEDALRGTEIYRELFPTFELENITIFPEVADTLHELQSRGIRLAICTSRGHDSLKRILTRNGLWDCFETVVTATDNIAPKPAPDLVFALLDRMNLKAEDVFVVGDTTFDIQMGKAAGCRTVAVTYGNHTKEQLEAVSPTHIITHFGTLRESLA